VTARIARLVDGPLIADDVLAMAEERHRFRNRSAGGEPEGRRRQSLATL
jgi:hypothetical protein